MKRYGKLYVTFNRVMHRLFKNPPLFSKAIKRNRIKLIHVHMGHNIEDFLLLSERFTLPLVVSFHGSDVYSYANYERNKSLCKKLSSGNTLFLVVSNHMKKMLIGFGCSENKIVVHHVGVNLEKFKFKERKIEKGETLKILCVANFTYSKGIPVLIRSLSEIKKIWPDLELRVVGTETKIDGHKEKNIAEELVQELRLQDYVIFRGFKNHNDIQDEYDWAHIFALPSRTAPTGASEGAPTVLMEAQASGLPVVSTYLTGIPEVVLDGVSGYLAREGDAQDLADKVCMLIRNHQLWPQMGRAGRTHIESNYNLTKQVQKLEDIYDIELGFYSKESRS
jgi:colanic acid/amylovoran biosynthesis glycosyltransferase